MKSFFAHKFTFFNLVFDLAVLSATLFVGWDPSRILAFYWLDLCVQVFFLILFMRWLGHLRLIFKLIVTFGVGIGIMLVYLVWIIKLAPFTSSSPVELNDVINRLLTPNYEVTFFLALSAFSNASFYKSLRFNSRNGLDVQFFTLMNCGMALLSIPLILLMTALIFMFTMNTRLSLIISILFLRNRLDYWRTKNMKEFNYK